jgi:hypothetical protein
MSYSRNTHIVSLAKVPLDANSLNHGLMLLAKTWRTQGEALGSRMKMVEGRSRTR